MRVTFQKAVKNMGIFWGTQPPQLGGLSHILVRGYDVSPHLEAMET